MESKPKKLNILGKPWTVDYFTDKSKVDHSCKDDCWGSINSWKMSINVYDENTPIEQIWHTIIHEVLHVFGSDGVLELLCDRGDNEKHGQIDRLALYLTQFLFQNNLLNIQENKIVDHVSKLSVGIECEEPIISVNNIGENK